MRYILLTLMIFIGTNIYSNHAYHQETTKKLAWGYGGYGQRWWPGAGFHFGNYLGNVMGGLGLPFWQTPYYYAPYY